jgi:hypothetical protein
MRGTTDKIDFAVAQRFIGAIERENQLGRDRDPLAFEKPKFRGRESRKIRVRDQVRNRQSH